MVVTVDLHIASEEASVAHDVVAVGVARRVELALAGDIPVGDGAGTLEHHVGDPRRRGSAGWLRSRSRHRRRR